MIKSDKWLYTYFPISNFFNNLLFKYRYSNNLYVHIINMIVADNIVNLFLKKIATFRIRTSFDIFNIMKIYQTKTSIPVYTSYSSTTKSQLPLSFLTKWVNVDWLFLHKMTPQHNLPTIFYIHWKEWLQFPFCYAKYFHVTV